MTSLPAALTFSSSPPSALAAEVLSAVASADAAEEAVLPHPEKTAAVRVKASRAAAVFLTVRFILNFSFISVVYRLFLHQDTKMPGA